MIETTTSPLEAFVDALARRDYDTLGSTLAPDVRFRALIPPGVREASTREGTIAIISGWFEDCERVEMTQRYVDTVVDRHHATYRIDAREGGVDLLAQQTIFATVDGNAIEKLDLICSGFRPSAVR